MTAAAAAAATPPSLRYVSVSGDSGGNGERNPIGDGDGHSIGDGERDPAGDGGGTGGWTGGGTGGGTGGRTRGLLTRGDLDGMDDLPARLPRTEGPRVAHCAEILSTARKNDARHEVWRVRTIAHKQQ